MTNADRMPTIDLTAETHCDGAKRVAWGTLRTIGLLAAALALMVALTGCKENKPMAEAPQPVRAMVVSLETAVGERAYVGTIRARYESDLGFRVAGKIAQRLVNVGDAVKTGQAIAKLDPVDLKLAVESNAAELAAAKSSLNQAAAAEQRFKQLLAQGHVSTAAYDQRKATADEARGRVERAERTLDLAKNQSTYATLAADADGVVVALPVEVGQVVAQGQTVARIAQTHEREAVVGLPEARLADARAASATVTLWSNGGKRYAATLREIAPQADAASRTFQARFALPEADHDVALGMTATVTLAGEGKSAVARVPASAIINDGRGAAVWVLDGDGTRVARRAIEIEAFGAADVLVTSGLTAGERIVSLGVHVLDEKKPVRVVETRAPIKYAADRRVGSEPARN